MVLFREQSQVCSWSCRSFHCPEVLFDQWGLPFLHYIQEEMSVSGSPGLKSGVSFDQIIRNLLMDWSVAVSVKTWIYYLSEDQGFQFFKYLWKGSSSNSKFSNCPWATLCFLVQNFFLASSPSILVGSIPKREHFKNRQYLHLSL